MDDPKIKTQPTRDTTRTPWVVISLSAGALIVAGIALKVAYSAICSVRHMSKEIVLVDDEGRPRVRIAATSQGGAVELIDEGGRSRIRLRQMGEDLTFSMHRNNERKESEFATRLRLDESSNSLEMHDRESGWASLHSDQVFSGMSAGNKSGRITMSASDNATSLALFFGSKSTNMSVSESSILHSHEGKPFWPDIKPSGVPGYPD